MLTFDGFVPGAELGRHELTLEPAHLEKWYRLFPDDRRFHPEMPPGMTAMVIMRAYAEVLTPRPPGNVHGAQRTELHRLPREGDRLITRFSCLGKELKGERRWVRFESRTEGEDGTPLFTGRMTILWAR